MSPSSTSAGQLSKWPRGLTWRWPTGGAGERASCRSRQDESQENLTQASDKLRSTQQRRASTGGLGMGVFRRAPRQTRRMLTIALGLLLAAALNTEALGAETQPVSNSKSSAGVAPGKELTPVQTTRASSNLSDATGGINLIPIDQPMLASGAETAPAASAVPTSPASIGRSISGQNEIDSYDGSRLNLRSGQVAAPVPGDESAPQQQQLLQYPANEEEFNEPVAQQHSNELSQQQQQQELGPLQQSNLAASRQLERRFGLFKKGPHFQAGGAQHYGAPANYLAGNFMNECERCLASFGQAAPSAELQLEPVQPVAPQPSLPPAPLPAQMGSQQHFPMQPFAPFKSKLFMKFPFLMKGGGGAGQSFESQQTLPVLSSYQPHYWPASSLQPYSGHTIHSHHSGAGPLRPAAQTSQALFVRPAPAYNCIQASPSMLQAAASTISQTQHEFIPLLGHSKTSPNPTKQQQQQQHHHHHHPQQQVQAGYARK